MSSSFPMIVGAGRSGTSLLRSMLGSHPEWHVPPESHFISRMCLAPARYSGVSGHEKFLSDVVANRRLELWKIDAGWLAANIPDSGSENSLRTLTRALYTGVATQHGATRFADKSPNYVLALARLHWVVGPIRAVHIVRDPRAVVASLLRTTGWGFDDTLVAAMYWRRCLAAAHRAEQVGVPVLTLRYEDLVAQPENQLRQMCDFLTTPFHSAMLDFREHGDAQQTEHRFAANHTKLSGPLAVNESWRQSLSVGQVDSIDAIAGHFLERFGYGQQPRGARRTQFRAGLISLRATSIPAVKRGLSGAKRLLG